VAGLGTDVRGVRRHDRDIRQARGRAVQPDAATLIRTLSGLATGASWWCYFRVLHIGDAARVAPLDKLSVVLVALFGVGCLGDSRP